MFPFEILVFWSCGMSFGLLLFGIWRVRMEGWIALTRWRKEGARKEGRGKGGGLKRGRGRGKRKKKKGEKNGLKKDKLVMREEQNYEFVLHVFSLFDFLFLLLPLFCPSLLSLSPPLPSSPSLPPSFQIKFICPSILPFPFFASCSACPRRRPKLSGRQEIQREIRKEIRKKYPFVSRRKARSPGLTCPLLSSSLSHTWS